jgi:outer membrane protein
MSRLKLSILFAAVCIPVLGMAQTPAQTPAAPATAVVAPVKIVWMNLEQALLTTDEGKSLVAEIQKFVDDKQKQMDGMKEEADRLANQLQVQGSKLTDEARADLQEQAESKNTAMERFRQDTQKEIENRQARMNNYLGKRMQPVIEKLAKERGISAVLIFNSSRDAYVDQSLNFTEEIIKAYNQTYPAGSKAPVAGAPAAAPKPPAAPAPAPKK